MGLIFEWDKKKAAENLRKHGVSFAEAATERVNKNETLSVRNLCLTRPVHPFGSWAC